MDKWNRHLRRRSSEIFVPSELAESSLADSLGRSDDQDVSRILSDYTKHPDATIEKWQLSEEKLKHPREKLSAALMDNLGRDDLVKQHMKLAEEAVSGWEKAEAEVQKLKQQLEVLVQQKLAAEDRVSHLDGALKECMCQLRLTREEQEQKIHEVIVKKTRGWETLRCELEEKLENARQQLLEAEEEKSTMSKTLQERGEVISERDEALSKDEAEIKLLRIQLDSAEKQISVSKHELHVLNKEMEIQNEKVEISKRGTDAADKQHIEDMKTISKLEAECQRLLVLLRRKLPGVAVLSQMKAESNIKRSGSKCPGSARLMHVEPVEGSICSPSSKESDPVLRRMLAMEKEIKRLKGTLARKNNELEDARLMCSQTAAKLSVSEQQLDAVSNYYHHPKSARITCFDMHGEVSRSCLGKEPSLASASYGQDGDPSCSEHRASALIAEFSQFKQEKFMHSSVLTPDTSTLDLMDDFIEMEQLASMSPSKIDATMHEIKNPKEFSNGFINDEKSDSWNCSKQNTSTLEQIIAGREAELQTAHELCKELSRKLVATEEQLSSLRSQHAANQSTLVGLQEKIELIFKAEQEGANLEKVVKDVSDSLESANSIVKLQAHIKRMSRSSYPDNVFNIDIHEGIGLQNSEKVPAFSDSSSECETSSSVSDTESSLHIQRSDLKSAVSNVVPFLEDLSILIWRCHNSVPVPKELLDSGGHCCQDLNICRTALGCSDFDVDNMIQKFIEVSNGLIKGKLTFQNFVGELSSILEQLRRRLVSSVDCAGRRLIDWKISPSEHKDVCEVYISRTSECDGSKKEHLSAISTVEPSTVRSEMSSITMTEEEVQKFQEEKETLEHKLKEEAMKNAELEEELARLKNDKAILEAKLEEEKGNLMNSMFELQEAEQFAVSLRMQLCSVEESKNKANEQILDIVAAKTRAETKLEAVEADLSELQDHIEVLEKEIHDKCQEIDFLEVKCQHLEQQVQETVFRCSRCADRDEETRLNKELEIAAAAEKLSECQRTIFLLSRQLKALASPRESMDLSYDSTEDSALSVDRSSSGRRRELSEASSSGGHIMEHDENVLPVPRRKGKQYHQGWSCRGIRASDVLNLESMKLTSKHQPSSGQATAVSLFTEESSPHVDCSESMTRTQSSSDAGIESTPRSSTRAATRKKRSPSSMGRIDFSKSLSDVISPAGSFEKHASSFSKLFSRTRTSQ